MEIELIARGNSEAIRKIAEDFVYAEKNGVFLISIPRNLLKYTLSLLKSQDVEAVEYSQYIQTMQSNIKAQEISKIDSEEAFKWFKTGNEFFHTISGSRFEMHSIDKRNVNVVSSAEPISKCFMSSSGCIYGFVRGNCVSFHMGDDLSLLWDLKLDCSPSKLIFSNGDEYVAISAGEKTHIYRLLVGELIYSVNCTEFFFIKNSVYLADRDVTIDLDSPAEKDLADLSSLSLEPKGISCCVFNREKSARFIDGKLQKIIYDNGKDQTVKNYVNVKKIEFAFTENRLFAFLVKSPGKEEHYSLDSILDGEVTSNSFDSRIIAWTVSDNFFAVQLSNYEVHFYTKEKHIFNLAGSVKKDCPVTFSIKNNICCLFDSSNNSVEFYDKGELRSIFSHPGCSHVKWSESGLFVATLTFNPVIGSLVQIFDCNGSLMFRKIYNALTDFEWRPMADISEEEKRKILSEHSLDEITEPEDDETRKKNQLLKEWIGYLMTKLNKQS